MMDIPQPVFLSMVNSGALTPSKDDKSFDINFAIIKDRFPSYLEYMVLHNLNEVEEWAYLKGYMAYEILPNGWLQWRPTGKLT
jgi:hypothetical protein